MKLCIIGSRSIDKAEVVFPAIDRFIKEHGTGTLTFLLGSAKGVDPLAKKYAEARGIDVVEFLPYHLLDTSTEFDSKHFFIRTKQMIDNADRVLALWDTKSKGTQYGIRYSQKKNLPVMVVKFPLEHSIGLSEEV